MGVKTNPRPKKERPIPLNTPTLSNRPHRKGLGVEGAELDGAEDHHGQHQDTDFTEESNNVFHEILAGNMEKVLS